MSQKNVSDNGSDWCSDTTRRRRSLLHVFLDILSPRIWPNDHRAVNERMKEVLMMEYHEMGLSASGWSVALLTVKCGCR